MQPDGRNITERVAEKVDGDIGRITKWIEKLAEEYETDADSHAKSKDYLLANIAQTVADALRGHIMSDARGAAFLPKELRPCIDGAGNRGSHKEYVRIKDGVDLCAFCGRP